MQEELLQQGVQLMLYGMGTVFVFLSILVFGTSLMSAIIARFNDEDPTVVGEPPPSPSTTDNNQLLAAISAAIHAYRSRHK